MKGSCDCCGKRPATHFIRAEMAAPVYCDTNACCECANCDGSCGAEDDEDAPEMPASADAVTLCAYDREPIDKDAPTSMQTPQGWFHGFGCLAAYNDMAAYDNASHGDEYELNDVSITPEGALAL